MSWYSEIQQWAKSLEAQWTQSKAQGIEFCDFATKQLKDRSFHHNFNLDQEIKNILEEKNYPHQLYPHSVFGDPPITLHFAEDKSFYLDLYIWMTSQTTIHQHGFEGAFTVLQGHSLEGDYEFIPEQAVGDAWFGKLIKKELRKVVPGDVRTIHLKEKMVHRVIHLAKPTVSLVLRTHSQSPVIQYNYEFDRLACNGHPPGDVASKLRVLRWYLNQGLTPTYKMIEPLLSYSELWNMLISYPHAHTLLKKAAFLHSSEDFINCISRQHQFISLFFELKTEEAKTLFVAYEFCGKNWTEWVEKNNGLKPDEAVKKLKVYLESTPGFSDAAKESLLKDLYFPA